MREKTSRRHRFRQNLRWIFCDSESISHVLCIQASFAAVLRANMANHRDLCRNYIEFFCGFFADLFARIAACADFLCIRNIVQNIFSGDFLRVWFAPATATPVGFNFCEFFFFTVAKLCFIKEPFSLPGRFFALRRKFQCFEI